MASENPTRGTRLPENLDEEFEEFRDTNDMTNSEALRTLVREGLEQKRSGPLDERPDGTLAGILWEARRDVHTFVLIGIMCTLLMVLTTGWVSALAGVIAALYAVTVIVAAIDALAFGSQVTIRLAEWAERRDLGVRA